MTAHIDESIESDDCAVNPHDCHALLDELQKVNYSKRGYMFWLALSLFFNALFIVVRIYG